MKILLDEHMPRAVAEQLRVHSHDAVAVTERPELRGLSDRDLFVYAQSEGRAIVTYNVDDFLDLDHEYRSLERAHAGLVLISARRFPRRSVGPLVRALEGFINAYAPYHGFVYWLQ